MTDEQLQQILNELRNINGAVQAVVTNTGAALEKLQQLLTILVNRIT